MRTKNLQFSDAAISRKEKPRFVKKGVLTCSRCITQSFADGHGSALPIRVGPFLSSSACTNSLSGVVVLKHLSLVLTVPLIVLQLEVFNQHELGLAPPEAVRCEGASTCWLLLVCWLPLTSMAVQAHFHGNSVLSVCLSEFKALLGSK